MRLLATLSLAEAEILGSMEEPVGNPEVAIESCRAVLRELDEAGHAELWAHARTVPDRLSHARRLSRSRRRAIDHPRQRWITCP